MEFHRREIWYKQKNQHLLDQMLKKRLSPDQVQQQRQRTKENQLELDQDLTKKL